ncbi:TetR/AcrR family transcriptional regulator [Amycolatopsis sp. CA-230715]|uniref:TetR/AcrR family transcriptional regulator n=1 Tax=Amycolatopsis sp. CA-230715 TaxID=2745196 RepID=UPI001C328872|nr:TetR/AcrR family transcriptional regulator [Amycolatopsis sp. CA-230715]QWF76664.1 putative HTH-type transcriptional regulator YxaF [Amycolatopsis sp. CA-230715]
MASGQAGAQDTRARVLEAAGQLFRRKGYTGTGLKQIAAESHAPFGSIYHFFPGGKEQLADDVIRVSGPEYGQLVMSLLDSVPDPIEALGFAFRMAAEQLAATDYEDACPIATIALEVASTNEKLRIATSDVFDAWITGATAWFGRFVPDQERAKTLAYAMISMLEGAFVLARAARSGEPLLAAGRSIADLARAAMDAD